jgi:hypothetical protein
MMAISTLELTRARQSVCPHCGHHVDLPHRSSWIEAGLGILTAIVLVLIVVPLGIMAWNSCRDILSDSEPHSILFHPLEDWTRY